MKRVYGVDRYGAEILEGDFIVGKALIYSNNDKLYLRIPKHSHHVEIVSVDVFGKVEGGRLKNVICLDKKYSLRIFNSLAEDSIPINLVSVEFNMSHQLRNSGQTDELIQMIMDGKSVRHMLNEKEWEVA